MYVLFLLLSGELHMDLRDAAQKFCAYRMSWTEKLIYLMKENNYIPTEHCNVAFNPYKHHLNFLRSKITDWKKMDWEDVAMELKLIGNNLIDLYYGRLKIEEIFNEIEQFAHNNNINAPESLAEWLSPLEYRKTVLSDNSFWVIKQGKDASRYLHIHPGKYSPFTVRVKAPALKTVIALKIFDKAGSFPDLSLVNRLRMEKLDLSPVKGLVEGKGIARLYSDFNLM